MNDSVSPQTRAFAQDVLARAKAVQDEAMAVQLPADLAAWTLEYSDNRARLVLSTDGYATSWQPPGQLAVLLTEARAILAREVDEGTVTVVAASFDYAALAGETRIVVQQATKEIHDELDTMRRSAISIGRRLVEVKAALPHGAWGPWLASEFGWSDQTARNYMQQARLAAQNPKFLEFEDRIEPAARTLLAAPSTPEPARAEALARAEAGETVRHRDAKEIVQAAKAEAAPVPPFDEAAPALSTFDRHTLTKQGYAITERTRLREDDVWEYELQPPPTIHGRPAPIWATLRRIGAIISGMEKPDRPPPPPAAPAQPVPTPAPELLDGVGRQPYGAKGADRWLPNVPHVLIIAERTHRYGPPPLIRAATIYDTPTTVRVKRPDGKEETQAQHKVWAVPNDAAWAEVEAATAAFGATLDTFAGVLRELGRYDRRLAENGGLKQIPDGPLCPTVARADDPDANNQSSWWLDAWHVPRLERNVVARHTAKMLTAGGENAYFFTQSDSWCLADDAAWEQVSAAQQACKEAAQAAKQLLDRLGTYEEALSDGRHQKQPKQPAHADGAPMSRIEEARAAAEAPDFTAQFAQIREVAAAQERAALVVEPDETGEDLDAQMLAAVGAILGGLPEPAVRILAAHLCFGDVSDVAFTAPLEQIYDGFAEVASQGTGGVMPAAWRAGARAALAALGLAGVPQKAAAD